MINKNFFYKNVTSNKDELNELLKKVKAILTKELIKDLINKFIILNGSKHFSSGIFENYLLFIAAKKYIKYFRSTSRINSWKSNEMSEENIQNITKSDSLFAPSFVDHHLLPDITFNGHCLVNNNTSVPKKVINIYFLHTESMDRKFKYRFYIR